LHGHAGMHGPCSRAITIRWPRAIFSAPPRRDTGGRRNEKEEGQGRPGNLPARARARRRGRGWSVVSRNGRSNGAASSLAPAVPPSPRYPAAALERRRPAGLEREGSRVRPLGRPKTEWNGGAGVGVDEEGRGDLLLRAVTRAGLRRRREQQPRAAPRALSGASVEVGKKVGRCEGGGGVRCPFYRRGRATGGRRTVASANPAWGTAAASGRESRERAGPRGVREGYEASSAFPRRERASRRRRSPGVCARVRGKMSRACTSVARILVGFVAGLGPSWRGKGSPGRVQGVGCGPDSWQRKGVG
jgi:hypothetical protein